MAKKQRHVEIETSEGRRSVWLIALLAIAAALGLWYMMRD